MVSNGEPLGEGCVRRNVSSGHSRWSYLQTSPFLSAPRPLRLPPANTPSGRDWLTPLCLGFMCFFSDALSAQARGPGRPAPPACVPRADLAVPMDGAMGACSNPRCCLTSPRLCASHRAHQVRLSSPYAGGPWAARRGGVCAWGASASTRRPFSLPGGDRCRVRRPSLAGRAVYRPLGSLSASPALKPDTRGGPAGADRERQAARGWPAGPDPPYLWLPRPPPPPCSGSAVMRPPPACPTSPALLPPSPPPLSPGLPRLLPQGPPQFPSQGSPSPLPLHWSRHHAVFTASDTRLPSSAKLVRHLHELLNSP